MSIHQEMAREKKYFSLISNLQKQPIGNLELAFLYAPVKVWVAKIKNTEDGKWKAGFVLEATKDINSQEPFFKIGFPGTNFEENIIKGDTIATWHHYTNIRPFEDACVELDEFSNAMNSLVRNAIINCSPGDSVQRAKRAWDAWFALCEKGLPGKAPSSYVHSPLRLNEWGLTMDRNKVSKEIDWFN
jgi:hypothetical protein